MFPLMCVMQTPTYPPVPVAADRSGFGRGIQRTMTLLETSRPKHRNTVRILFYGQSITEQDWSRQVAEWLRAKYPNANLIIENRAIGGHSTQLLWRTSEADLYPFQPDLMILSVLGSHIDYETIIRNVLQKTVAEVLVQTDHITRDEDVPDPATQPTPTMSNWSAWWNQIFLPDLVKRYPNLELLDQRALWRPYLVANHLKPRELTVDGTHLNAQGCWIMAQLVEQHFVYHPEQAKSWSGLVKDLKPKWRGGRLEMDFTGNRVDLVSTAADAGKQVRVLIDGKAPSSFQELYGVTRVSPWPRSSWPLILRTSAKQPLILEDWSVSFHDVSPDCKSFAFEVTGSKTGPDGGGRNDAPFVSNSGRVAIEPEDWNMAYCKMVFKTPFEPDLKATWKVVPHFVDEPVFASVSDPSIDTVVTVAQGLTNGPHKLVLEAETGAKPVLKAIRVYNPPLSPDSPAKP